MKMKYWRAEELWNNIWAKVQAVDKTCVVMTVAIAMVVGLCLWIRRVRARNQDEEEGAMIMEGAIKYINSLNHLERPLRKAERKLKALYDDPKSMLPLLQGVSDYMGSLGPNERIAMLTLFTDPKEDPDKKLRVLQEVISQTNSPSMQKKGPRLVMKYRSLKSLGPVRLALD